MKLSVITINYNNKLGLQKTIESVLSQTTDNYEFIVIDGNSTDGSKELIEQYKSKFHYSVSEPDSGIYNAMNKGILKSNGEYLLFLNSGDVFESSSSLKNIFSHLDNTDVISGDLYIEENDKVKYVSSKNEVTLDFFFEISLYHQATFVKRKLFTDFGLYDESFKIGGDYEFFIRTLYKHNCSYKHVSVPISRFKTDGISNNKAFIELNKLESKKAWLLNVSERTYNEFEKYYKLLKSDEIYLKSRSSLFRISTKISKFFFSIRFFLYKKFKEKK